MPGHDSKERTLGTVELGTKAMEYDIWDRTGGTGQADRTDGTGQIGQGR